MNLLYALKSRFYDVLSPITGLLLTLAFAPVGYWFLSFFSLAFIFASWQVLSPRRAALRGFLFGLGYFGVGVSWVFVSINEFGHASIIISSLITLVFVAAWATFIALTGYLVSKLCTYFNSPLLFINSSLWILIEYFRGTWFLNGFPWLQIAYSQTDSVLAGYAPVIGVYGVGFLIAAVSECLIYPRHSFKAVVIKLSIIIGLFLGGTKLSFHDWTYPIGDEIQVSLIQGNISQDKKWEPNNRDATLKKYHELTQQNWQSPIIIWPETAIPVYYSEIKDNYLVVLKNEAIKNKTDIIISLPIKEESGEKFNAVMVLGDQIGFYRKNHLLPFGEYLPLQPFSRFVFDRLNIKGLGSFTPGGQSQPLMKAGGYPFATSVCYEAAFGNEQRLALPDAAFLVNVTNDAWFGNTLESYQHLQIARMRAIETGRYLLRATNTGISAIVEPNGKIKNSAPQFQTAIVTSKILPMGGTTPYANLGDSPIIAGVLCVLAITFIFGISQPKKI